MFPPWLGLAIGGPPAFGEKIWSSSFSLFLLLLTSYATDIFWNKQVEARRRTMGADNYYLTDNYHKFTFFGPGGDLKYGHFHRFLLVTLLDFTNSPLMMRMTHSIHQAATLPSATSFLDTHSTQTLLDSQQLTK